MYLTVYAVNLRTGVLLPIYEETFKSIRDGPARGSTAGHVVWRIPSGARIGGDGGGQPHTYNSRPFDTRPVFPVIAAAAVIELYEKEKANVRRLRRTRGEYYSTMYYFVSGARHRLTSTWPECARIPCDTLDKRGS